MSYTKAIYANSHCVACMSSPTLLTLQGLSAKVKLHDRKSAKDGHQVEGNEKRVEVSTWLSCLSVVHEGHIWKHTLRVMHDFTTFLTLQGSSGKAKLQGNQSANEVQPVAGKRRGLEVSTWHLIYLSYTKAIYANSHCVACIIS